jgi:hypothetical protein
MAGHAIVRNIGRQQIHAPLLLENGKNKSEENNMPAKEHVITFNPVYTKAVPTFVELHLVVEDRFAPHRGCGSKEFFVYHSPDEMAKRMQDTTQNFNGLEGFRALTEKEFAFFTN